MSRAQVLERLLTDGFLRQESTHYRAATRWHAAVARAAKTLMARGEELEDLRVPVAWALSETYAESVSDDDLVEMAAVMTPFTGVAPTNG